MKQYWIISNAVQYGVALLFLVTAVLPSKRFGSQGYGGWGQMAVLFLLVCVFNLAAINSCIAGCVAHAKGAIGKAWFWYAIGQVVLYISGTILVVIKLVKG